VKFPIPGDWDGETWRCINVQWPVSPMYDALLIGVLTLLRRGRFYDEGTGLITLAQAVGQQIFERNYPFTNCGEDCPDCPDCPDLTAEDCRNLFGGGGSVCYEDDDMPCLDLTSLIKIENGTLYVRNACCEWIAIAGALAAGGLDGTLTGGSEPLPPEADTPTSPTPLDLSCRKAWVFAHTLSGIGAVGFDSRNDWMFTWIGNVRDAFPQLELSKWKLAEAFSYLSAAQMLAFLNWPEAWPNDVAQNVLCRWASVLSTDKIKTTEDEFTEMKSILKNTTSGFAEMYLAALMDAIGRSGLDYMALSAQYQDVPGCECPGEGYIIGPDDDGWYLGPPICASRIFPGEEYVRACVIDYSDQDVFGYVILASWDDIDDTLKREGCSAGTYCDEVPDSSLFGTTSDHLEALDQGLWFVCCGETLRPIAAALLGAASYHSLGITHETVDPENPHADFLAGKKICIRFDHDVSEGGYFQFTEVRPIHNMNSPSHG
jgi:hypothetical protein